jgi:hypothetical protein
MRFLVTCLLFACAAASGQTPARPDQPDSDLSRAAPAWLMGDHVQARRLFRAAAERGHPLGQYSLRRLRRCCAERRTTVSSSRAANSRSGPLRLAEDRPRVAFARPAPDAEEVPAGR